MPVRICFVCLGNMCRSPTAAALLERLARTHGIDGELVVESAGTGHWITGGPPHPDSIRIAAAHGVDVCGEARRLLPEDFDRFDHILSLDSSVHATIQEICPDPELLGRVELLRSYDPLARGARDVPDPYGGSEDAFRETFAVCQRACRGLFDALRARYGW
jgi:protein-tyrosine phosphatase